MKYRNTLTAVLLALGGLAAGFLNGLLGAGGGVVLVLLLGRLLPPSEENARSAYASALCVTLPLSVLTLFRYLSSGNAGLSESTLDLFVPYILGAVLGGLLGALLLGRLKSGALRRIFALLTMLSGLLMLAR